MTPLRFVLSLVRSSVTVPISLVFLSHAFSDEFREALVVSVMLLSASVLILYVEGWMWWNTVFHRQRHPPDNGSE